MSKRYPVSESIVGACILLSVPLGVSYFCSNGPAEY